MWGTKPFLWVRLNTYLVFKGSPTCRLSSWMWACVAAAVHRVTKCSYSFLFCFFFSTGAHWRPGGLCYKWRIHPSCDCQPGRLSSVCKSVSCWGAYTHWPSAKLAVHIVHFRNSSHMFQTWMCKIADFQYLWQNFLINLLFIYLLKMYPYYLLIYET